MTDKDKLVERLFVSVVRHINSIVHDMTRMGECDMAVLTQAAAGRFHEATEMLRDLAHDLKHDPLWPHEAGPVD